MVKSEPLCPVCLFPMLPTMAAKHAGIAIHLRCLAQETLAASRAAREHAQERLAQARALRLARSTRRALVPRPAA